MSKIDKGSKTKAAPGKQPAVLSKPQQPGKKQLTSQDSPTVPSSPAKVNVGPNNAPKGGGQVVTNKKRK